MARQDAPARTETVVPESESAEDRTDTPRTVARGLAAGAFATVVMTAFRIPISRSPPPTARFWARFVGDGDPNDYVGRGLLMHLLYGTVAGGVFGGLVGPFITGSDANRERTASLLGAGYGVVLSTSGIAVLLDRLLGLDLDPDERFVFHVSHVIYGIALGTWFGAADGSDPD